MKQAIYFLFILSSFSVHSVSAQDVSLPLGPFRDFLLARYPTCFVNANGNGELMLNTACIDVVSEDSLEFRNLSSNSSEALDLTGLQYFTSLVYLDCSDNYIQTYVYPPNLKYLNCSRSMADAPFGVFPTFPNSLETLICIGNSASVIPFTPNLIYIDITGNYRTSLPTLPAGLETLICANQGEPTAGRLTSLPALNASLKYLDCSGNQLSVIPTLPASLLTLKCSGNKAFTSPEDYNPTLAILPSLPVNLEFLDCSNNKINSLPALPATLKHLNCSGQRLFEGDKTVSPPQPDLIYNEGISLLPALPAGLEYLNCSYNKISSLPSSLPPGLTFLNCSNNVYTFGQNPITTGISCLPFLPSTLLTLNTARTLINCLPNSGSYSSSPVRPLCSPVNNSNLCVAFPIMSGHIYYDNNSNGQLDPGENFRSNVEVLSGAGQNAYSGINGYVELSGNIGSNSLTINPPYPYVSIPATSSYTFNTYDTVVHENYGLQPQQSIDSVTVTVIPITTARPGFNHLYKVNYENVGTTVLSTNMLFYFDAPKMTYLSSTLPGVVNNATFLTIPLIPVTPGDRGSFYLNFNVLPSTNLGDTIQVVLRATSNTSISTDSIFSVVFGSFDPNDKRSTPVLSPQQVSAGTYINYLVRFQNTGTDTAFNIVITDVLSSDLDAGSFQMIDASHPAKIKRSGNNISFEFIDIQLPDSNINELASHGYIRFRVRPQPTVIAGTVIPNTASIYFDFNAPIITNIANTRIEATVVPLTLLSFSAVADDANIALLYWKTAEESNTKHFVVERSLNGRIFDPVGIVSANGWGGHSYQFKKSMQSEVEYFRLKMVDIDGKFSYSQVIKIKMITPGKFIYVLVNPVKKMLSIEANHLSLIGSGATLLDNTGKTVYKFIIKGGRQDEMLPDLSPGIYYLRTVKETLKLFLSY